ncbi:MAG: response regulator [Planctomycetia bacterium]|nr:response regulator [Planctomycetia bacterium]
MSKVLVIDDEPGYRASLEFFLTQAGNRVVTAGTAAEAVELAADFQPEVLVADWLLGEQQTGLDVARRLQSLIPALQTIIITALSEDEVRQKATEADVFQCVEKPFEPGALVDAVRRAASQSD